MASNMVKRKFDNKHFLNSGDAIRLIEKLFKTGFPYFTKINVYDRGDYFGVRYKWKSYEIQFGGGRGFFEHELFIDGKEYSLREYNSDMDCLKAASESNISFAFNILKKFIAERHKNPS